MAASSRRLVLLCTLASIAASAEGFGFGVTSSFPSLQQHQQQQQQQHQHHYHPSLSLSSSFSSSSTAIQQHSINSGRNTFAPSSASSSFSKIEAKNAAGAYVSSSRITTRLAMKKSELTDYADTFARLQGQVDADLPAAPAAKVKVTSSSISGGISSIFGADPASPSKSTSFADRAITAISDNVGTGGQYTATTITEGADMSIVKVAETAATNVEVETVKQTPVTVTSASPSSPSSSYSVSIVQPQQTGAVKLWDQEVVNGVTGLGIFETVGLLAIIPAFLKAAVGADTNFTPESSSSGSDFNVSPVPAALANLPAKELTAAETEALREKAKEQAYELLAPVRDTMERAIMSLSSSSARKTSSSSSMATAAGGAGGISRMVDEKKAAAIKAYLEEREALVLATGAEKMADMDRKIAEAKEAWSAKMDPMREELAAGFILDREEHERELQEKARIEAEAKAKAEAEAKAIAEAKAKAEAEAKVAKEKEEAERRAIEEAKRLKAEAEAKAAKEKEEAEKRAIEEAKRLKAEAEAKAAKEKEEAEKKATEEEAKRVKAEAEAKAAKEKEEAEKKAAEEEAKRAKAEAEAKAAKEKEEAEKKAAEEEARRVKAEAEAKAQAKAAKEKEEAEKKAAEEEAKRVKAEAEAKAAKEREEAEKKAAEEEAKRVKAETEVKDVTPKSPPTPDKPKSSTAPTPAPKKISTTITTAAADAATPAASSTTGKPKLKPAALSAVKKRVSDAATLSKESRTGGGGGGRGSGGKSTASPSAPGTAGKVSTPPTTKTATTTSRPKADTAPTTSSTTSASVAPVASLGFGANVTGNRAGRGKGASGGKNLKNRQKKKTDVQPGGGGGRGEDPLAENIGIMFLVGGTSVASRSSTAPTLLKSLSSAVSTNYKSEEEIREEERQLKAYWRGKVAARKKEKQDYLDKKLGMIDKYVGSGLNATVNHINNVITGTQNLMALDQAAKAYKNFRLKNEHGSLGQAKPMAWYDEKYKDEQFAKLREKEEREWQEAQAMRKAQRKVYERITDDPRVRHMQEECLKEEAAASYQLEFAQAKSNAAKKELVSIQAECEAFRKNVERVENDFQAMANKLKEMQAQGLDKAEAGKAQIAEHQKEMMTLRTRMEKQQDTMVQVQAKADAFNMKVKHLQSIADSREGKYKFAKSRRESCDRVIATGGDPFIMCEDAIQMGLKEGKANIFLKEEDNIRETVADAFRQEEVPLYTGWFENPRLTRQKEYLTHVIKHQKLLVERLLRAKYKDEAATEYQNQVFESPEYKEYRRVSKMEKRVIDTRATQWVAMEIYLRVYGAFMVDVVEYDYFKAAVEELKHRDVQRVMYWLRREGVKDPENYDRYSARWKELMAKEVENASPEKKKIMAAWEKVNAGDKGRMWEFVLEKVLDMPDDEFMIHSGGMGPDGLIKEAEARYAARKGPKLEYDEARLVLFSLLLRLEVYEIVRIVKYNDGNTELCLAMGYDSMLLDADDLEGKEQLYSRAIAGLVDLRAYDYRLAIRRLEVFFNDCLNANIPVRSDAELDALKTITQEKLVKRKLVEDEAMKPRKVLLNEQVRIVWEDVIKSVMEKKGMFNEDDPPMGTLEYRLPIARAAAAAAAAARFQYAD